MENNPLPFSPIPASLAWSIRGVETLLQRHPSLTHRWHYEPGVALLAVQRVWEQTGEPRYFDYLRANIDELVGETGQIRTYDPETYNLDQINQGKVLFALVAQTGEPRYQHAILHLRRQLETHPRNPAGGYWHKLIYPHQMWLDGVYMADPFLAQFARAFDEPHLFDDIARQVLLLTRQARDPRTGLLYHAWDESRSQLWADPLTGCSPHFWGRALGWFMMALPDILDDFPPEHPQRDSLVRVLRQTAEAVLAVQDPASGTWYQILDQGDRPGNYLESSVSCMFVYVLAKGVRLGYLDAACLPAAQRGYQGLLERFIEVDGRGWLNLHGIVSVGGLGGTPYRDGSYEYYLSEPVLSNDYKGFGPFIMASLEIEKANQAPGGAA